MSIEKNVQIVKNFLAALGRRDKQGLLALSEEQLRKNPKYTLGPFQPCVPS
jgi:hypothetical protein